MITIVICNVCGQCKINISSIHRPVVLRWGYTILCLHPSLFLASCNCVCLVVNYSNVSDKNHNECFQCVMGQMNTLFAGTTLIILRNFQV